MNIVYIVSLGVSLGFSPAPWMPNARGQLLPEAGATQERTLFAVACTPLFGMALATIVVPPFSEPRLTMPSVNTNY